jgi:UDP-2-acetamido-3-amino-2,3-dideoxy-glucuronate N-acetyltransferase
MTFDDFRAHTSSIHATSLVEEPCRIGERTSVLPFAHVMPHVVIGQDCVVGHRVTVHSGVMVGDDVRLMANSVLISGLIIENGVYCGPNIVFAPPRRVRSGLAPLSQVSPTLVRQGASIGPNTTVVAGHTMGRFCLIEAGTVVDRPIPDYAIVMGNPLTLKGWRCQCGETLAFGGKTTLTECGFCGQHYQQLAEYSLVKINRPDSAKQDRRGA